MTREIISLVMNNIPWDVAWSLDRDELMAYNVIVRELKSGKQFDWRTYTWSQD